MRRLLFVSSSFPSGQGEGFAIAELQALAEEGVDVTVLPVYPRGNSDLIKNPGHTWTLPLLRWRYIVASLLFSIRHPIKSIKLAILCLTWGAKKTLTNMAVIPKVIFVYKDIEKYDFIYAYWASAPAQFAMLLSTISNVKWGFCAHRWDLVESNNFHRKFSSATFVRFISESGISLLSTSIQKKFRNKIKIIHVGINTAIERKNSSPFTAQFRCICIANLVNVKGLFYLIQAMSLITDGNVYLDLIGEGPLQPALAQQIDKNNLSEKVKLLGVRRHSEVMHLLGSGQYHCFILPSLDLGNGEHEGIPVALMEAMSFSMPVISTHTGGIPELLGINSEYGICVEQKNAHQIVEAINALKNYPETYQRYSIAGRKRVCESFDAKRNARQLLSVMFLN